MRNFINIITEALKPTNTKTHNASGFDILSQLDKGALANLPPSNRNVASRDTKLPGKRSRKPFKAIELNPEVSGEASQHFANAMGNEDFMNARDTISDEEARRRAGVENFSDDMPDYEFHNPNAIDTTIGIEPRTPGTDLIAPGTDLTSPYARPTTENLPMVIGKEVAETTNGSFDPEWTAVKHLPNYIQAPIRALGRQVFGQFTDTPIEDIMMIGTIGGLNSESDVVQMMGWIKHHGTKNESANLDFSRIMPGYSANVTCWSVTGYTFLLVKDMAGYYIYGWASDGSHSIGHTDRLRLTKEAVEPKAKFKDLDRVELTTKVKKLPAGSKGTIVGVWKGGKSYEVEFTKPVECLVTVTPDKIKLTK